MAGRPAFNAAWIAFMDVNTSVRGVGAKIGGAV